MKKCRKCEKDKDIGLFCKDASRKDGYRSQCKECYNKHQSVMRTLNREKRREYMKDWWSKNKDRINAYQRKYYHENKERISERDKRWISKNTNKYYKSRKKWRDEDKAKYPDKWKERK